MNKILLFATVIAGILIAFLILNDDDMETIQTSTEVYQEENEEKKDEIAISYEKSPTKAPKKKVIEKVAEQEETLVFDNVYILSEASTETFSIYLISDSELTQPQNMFPQIPAIVKGTINSQPFSIMIPIGVLNNDMRFRIINQATKVTKEFKKLMTRLNSGDSKIIHFDFKNLQSSDFEETTQINISPPSLPTSL